MKESESTISLGVTATAADEPVVAGVVLAAGTSSRYGSENKLLVDINGETVVRRSVRTLVESIPGPIVVITGHNAARIEAELAAEPVETVRNSRYREGQSTSIATGVQRLAVDADAIVFALGDMPCVDPTSVDAIIQAYVNGPETALAAAYHGNRGNPVLFDARHFEALQNVSGDVGGREIFLTADQSRLIETDDPGVIHDIDIPADVNRPDAIDE